MTIKLHLQIPTDIVIILNVIEFWQMYDTSCCKYKGGSAHLSQCVYSALKDSESSLLKKKKPTFKNQHRQILKYAVFEKV